MREFQPFTLEDLNISFIDGDRGKNYPSQNDFTDKGYCVFLNTKNVRKYGFDFSDVQYISKEKDSALRKGKIQDKDIILTTRGTVGNTAYYEQSIPYKNVRINSGMVIVRANEKIVDSRFLLYFLRSLDYDVFVSGSAQSQLPIRDLKKIEINLPPITEQKSISSVLSSLDNKIDLLHRQNKTLEAMAETLFRQWFILDVTGVSVSIEQVIDFNPKRTLTKSQDATYLDMAGLSTDIFRATGYYKRPFSSGTKFTKRDTLLARITPCLENGKAAYIDFLDENETGWGSTEFIVMRPKKEIHPMISYTMCRNPDFKEYAESCMEGSTGRQRVNLDHLKKFSVNLPSVATLGMLNELLDSFESRLVNNSQQIDSLEKLRDTLLPKLMSGEVRVQYAEEAIASVA
ncbi:restriction endonuclease subunit S [Atlantibacter hermannii]|uniref:restriction endonuclease subunit S n=1 Tax=Atlantibacter hermannii TaxID=565 RepID=UPI002898906D|nr:restriction endonuclease subunit S [Atlantibacter hermannii]